MVFVTVSRDIPTVFAILQIPDKYKGCCKMNFPTTYRLCSIEDYYLL